MKTLLSRLLPVCAALWLAVPALTAQPTGPGATPPGMNATLTKLFGPHKAFTARVEVQVSMVAQKDAMSMPMTVSMLDGRMRSEVDMGQVKSAQMPPQAAASLKNAGLDRVVSIVRLDKKEMWLIYPGLLAYVTMPLPAEELASLEKEPKIEKTALGRETIDGHACVKHKIVMEDDTGQKREALVWNATDLKDFPVKIQIKEKGDTLVMLYKDIQLERPDPKLFEPPSDYTRYSDFPQLMQKAMQRMMGGVK